MDLAQELESLFDRLWPILRSISGPGARQTHEVLGEIAPLKRIEVPSGTRVFDWTIPKEWRVQEAFVLCPDGRRILDVRDNNLHLLNYSAPFRGIVSQQELDRHLFSRPNLPDAVPYVTSYYKERWGFCIADSERRNLPDGDYQVVIDADLVEGSLTLSECILPGESDEEIFFSSFTCHPSMANNELAGPLVQAVLCRELARRASRRYTYRFVWHPETIGSIAYLHLRGDTLKRRMAAGFGFCCVGDGRRLTFKESRCGTTLADKVAEFCLKRYASKQTFIKPFEPFDGDERQYCSPGFDLPYGCFMHTPPRYVSGIPHVVG